jgi:hypothetical protein
MSSADIARFVLREYSARADDKKLDCIRVMHADKSSSTIGRFTGNISVGNIRCGIVSVRNDFLPLIAVRNLRTFHIL